jgi:hypothetical protein
MTGPHPDDRLPDRKPVLRRPVSWVLVVGGLISLGGAIYSDSLVFGVVSAAIGLLFFYNAFRPDRPATRPVRKSVYTSHGALFEPPSDDDPRREDRPRDRP